MEAGFLVDASLSGLFEEPSQDPLIIAEIGSNHRGNLELAKRMVLAARDAGTPFVKFQTYIPERLIMRSDPRFKEFTDEALSFEDFRELKRFCDANGTVFLSTPFDPESADFLEDLGVPVFKIASGDLTYISLLRYVAEKGKPIFLSTGASTWEDIDEAVRTIREVRDVPLVLMHCTAAYPCPDEEANLAVIPALKQRYACPAGFSDHTSGGDIALGAAALGAVVIEKHFTIDRSLPGGDNDISLVPEELKALKKGLERIHRALGTPDRKKTPGELKIDHMIHRGIIARQSLAKGLKLSGENLDMVRPSHDLTAADLDRVLGKRLTRQMEKGEVLTMDDLEP
jgi:N,N'-diacetyllegionaminate synthase